VSVADIEILGRMWQELQDRAPGEPLSRELAERWWDEDVEYIEDPHWPGSGHYRGLDEVMRAWNGYLEVFESAEMKLERVFDAGNEAVFFVRVTGISKGADVPFDHLWGYVCRVRNGKLAYQRAYWDPQQALEAAGVS